MNYVYLVLLFLSQFRIFIKVDRKKKLIQVLHDTLVELFFGNWESLLLLIILKVGCNFALKNLLVFPSLRRS